MRKKKKRRLTSNPRTAEGALKPITLCTRFLAKRGRRRSNNQFSNKENHRRNRSKVKQLRKTQKSLNKQKKKRGGRERKKGGKRPSNDYKVIPSPKTTLFLTWFGGEGSVVVEIGREEQRFLRHEGGIPCC